MASDSTGWTAKREREKEKEVNLSNVKSLCGCLNPETIDNARDRLIFHHGDASSHPIFVELEFLKSAILNLKAELKV